MAAIQETLALETLDSVLARHRKEKRDLQSVITNKKKNASKKARKAVNAECDVLEKTMKERHGREVTHLDGEAIQRDEEAEEEAAEIEGLDAVTTGGNSIDITQEQQHAERMKEVRFDAKAKAPVQKQQHITKNGQVGGGTKQNRQKARLARKQAAVLADMEQAEKEASEMTDHRGIERAAMEPVFKSNKLIEHEIPADGHCLFSAIADQLCQNSIPLIPDSVFVNDENKEEGPPCKVVRKVAAKYMRDRPDDFAPFVGEEEQGGFEGYLDRIRDTADWGGELELAACSGAYEVEIRVVQQGRIQKIPDHGKEKDEKNKVLWVAFYRRHLGLGEHYNSLRKAS